MLDGYSDRMIRRERLTRVAKDGSRMSVDRWFGKKDGPSTGSGRAGEEDERAAGLQARPGARSGFGAAENSREDEGADAPSQDK